MKEIKPFDTSEKPKRPYPFLMPIEWVGSLFYLLHAKCFRIRRHNCESLKPPYLLLSNHASMIDFPIAVKAVFPRRANWVMSIEEFVGREFLMRGVGGIYKRKFTSDIVVIRHMLEVLRRRKGICVMYPEARFSLAGINERMSPALGRMVKSAKCAVAVLIEHGNFICEPQWNKKPNRGNRVTAELTQIVTAEEVSRLSADEIQKRIEDAFVYDDYRWQLENKVRVTSSKRANNIHRILYQCPVCRREFSMNSKDTSLWCEACGAKWEMNEYGQLLRQDGEDVFTHVPDWYRWERANVREEVRAGKYHFEDTARVEHLDNARVGFRAIGTVKLTHDENGFVLEGKLDNGEDFRLQREVLSMESVHIEYDFHKKGVLRRGNAIDLCTLDDTYFAFPLTAKNPLTKIHFATEELYDFFSEKRENESDDTPSDQ